MILFFAQYIAATLCIDTLEIDKTAKIEGEGEKYEGLVFLDRNKTKSPF